MEKIRGLKFFTKQELLDVYDEALKILGLENQVLLCGMDIIIKREMCKILKVPLGWLDAQLFYCFGNRENFLNRR